MLVKWWMAFEGTVQSLLLLKIFSVSVIGLDLVSLGGKKLFGPRPQNRILVPFR